MAGAALAWFEVTVFLLDQPLTKSEFLNWRECAKCAWLARYRPEVLQLRPASAFDRMLMADGYAVEREFRALVERWPDGADFEFQVTFEANGCLARVDLVRNRANGCVDLYEIKSSTSVKSGTRDHIIDLAFQCEIARLTGIEVVNAFLVHIDGAYLRNGNVNPAELFIIVDATDRIAQISETISQEIDQALQHFSLTAIDERGCGCRYHGSISRRCLAFAHLNPDVPDICAHLLPRISRTRLEKLDRGGSLAMEAVKEDDVTPMQLMVLKSFHSGTPIVDEGWVGRFLDDLAFPLMFYDYESFASAVPIADGLSPHSQIPVQFSMHVLAEDGSVSHHEYLCDTPGAHRELVDTLASVTPKSGTVLVWNESYEKSCNRRLAKLLPDHAAFLADINERTVDLMKPFRCAFVDSRFMGSTSIKKVLPVLCPQLRYDENQVHDGAGAMEAWFEMVSTIDAQRKVALRQQLLNYCRLDSLAMIEIWRVLMRVCGRPTI